MQFHSIRSLSALLFAVGALFLQSAALSDWNPIASQRLVAYFSDTLTGIAGGDLGPCGLDSTSRDENCLGDNCPPGTTYRTRDPAPVGEYNENIFDTRKEKIEHCRTAGCTTVEQYPMTSFCTREKTTTPETGGF